MGTNIQQRIHSLEGEQTTFSTLFEDMYRQLEGQTQQTVEIRDLVEQMSKSIELGKMERAELIRKMNITDDRMENLEAYMKNLPSTPEKTIFDRNTGIWWKIYTINHQS